MTKKSLRNILSCNIIQYFTGLLILIFPSSYSWIIKCLSAAPTDSIRKCSIPSKYCLYYQLWVQYKMKYGSVFVSLPVSVIELLLAFCGNQVDFCFAGSREGLLTVTSGPPSSCWSISLSWACQFQTGLLGNQNLRVSDAGADAV